MEDPEDKGPRYRLVMFIAIAAILVPGCFLLSWLGDNGVSNLMRGFLGLDTRPRATRTAAPATATQTVVFAPTTSHSPSGTPAPTSAPAAATPAPTAPPAAATPRPTQAPQPTQPPAAPATATPVPPRPTATNTPRPPTLTPTPQGLGWGAAVPAYGGAAVIRAEADSESGAVGSIPLGDRVFVIRLVEGEAIDPVEPRWWEVDYQGVRGFVYYKLIKLE